jgi:hypothetical protein
MTEPRFEVGQEVWCLHSGFQGLAIFRLVIKAIEPRHGSFLYNCLSDYYIWERELFPTSAALLENIKTQIEELEK